MIRRDFLRAAALAPVEAYAGRSLGDDRADDRRSSLVPLRLVAEIGGRKLVYDQADGEDAGDFRGPGFVQRCIRVTRPDSPLTVFFRPDRDSGRVEVVVELGRCWGEANRRAANLAAYRVAILRGDAVLARIGVERHWWFSRWRWQSSPRRVVNSPTKLIQKGWVPAFDPALATHCKPSKPATYAGPMDNAGVWQGMHATGDRPDIGLFTECQAEYLATSHAGALASLLAQAEAAGSVPWNLRDERTGAPVDLERRPKALWYGPHEVDGWENVKLTGETGWVVDVAHCPALSYVPYLLTGDPYYLENLQFQAAFAIGSQSTNRPEYGPIVQSAQTRAYAWGLRSVIEAAAVTPAEVPSWLLPRASWGRVLAANRRWFEATFLADSSPAATVFRQAVDLNPRRGCSWQEGFLTAVLAHAVRLGFADWRPILEWKAGAAIALADGRHGWPKQWPSPYYYALNRRDGTPVTTWAEAWDLFKAGRPTSGQPKDWYSGPPIDESTWPPFPAWAQPDAWARIHPSTGSLALCAALGVKGAGAASANIRAIVAASSKNRRWAYRWAFAATERPKSSAPTPTDAGKNAGRATEGGGSPKG